MVVAILAKKTLKTTMLHKKWSSKIQVNFLLQLSELLHEGFPLIDGLHFLQITMGSQKKAINAVSQQLERGFSFVDAIQPLGFNHRMLTQLHLSVLNGNFVETLNFCAEYIQTIDKQRRMLKKVAIYPLFLVFMAITMLFIVRRFMLPTLQSVGGNANNLTRFVLWYLKYLPHIAWGTTSVLFITLCCFGFYWKKKDVYNRACFLTQIPLVGNYVRLYYSFYFARELSCFLENGLSVSQMIEMMKQLKTDPLMAELAHKMSNSLLSGDTLPHFISDTLIFNQEMSWIIHHGELTSQVAIKLKFYSVTCFKELIERIERLIQIVQPVIFMGIGLLVILIYLTLMLPMLNMMRGVY